MNIVTVNNENLDKYPGAICFINRKNPSFSIKRGWLNDRFSEGLRIKLLYNGKTQKLVGFIEYTPGEYAWRAVSAKNYLFIHCIWIYPNNNKNQGLGSSLIDICINDAKSNNFNGVAVIASKNAFMANSSLFLKNGFSKIESDNEGNDLLAVSFRDGKLPAINDWKSKLGLYNQLHVVYTKQCPWVARMVEEIKGLEHTQKLGLQIKELKTAVEAQNAPSVYASFNLIYNGKLLADRYISITHFNNILKKEKLI